MNQDDVIRQAFANLDSSNSPTRIEAIRTLGQLKVKDAVSLLIALLPDRVFGGEAALALIWIGAAALRDSADLFQQPDFNSAKGVSVAEDDEIQILRFNPERNWAYIRTMGGAEGWLWAALLRTAPPEVGAKPQQEFGPDLEETIEEEKQTKQDSVENRTRDTRREIPADLLDEFGGEPARPGRERNIPAEQQPPAPPPPAQPPSIAPADRGGVIDDKKGTEPSTSTPAPAPGAVIRRPLTPEPAPTSESTPADQAVQLSTYYPKEVAPNVWGSLRAYIYHTFAAPQVLEDAKQILGDSIRDQRHAEEPARAAIQEGAQVTATPELPGFQFNPPSITLLFLEDWHRFDFKMRTTTAPLNQAANGRITFTVEGVIVADLPISIFVTPTVIPSNPSGGSGGGNPTISASLASTTTKPYQSIFCSYSHKDTWIVERVEKAYKALGMDFLRDVVKLKSGQNWNAELLNMIDRADIFQLFWSTNSAQSKYVKQEWEYALSRTVGREAFIRPVYWEEPMPPVPDQLSKIHFAFEPELDDK